MNYAQVKAQFLGLMKRRDLNADTALQETFMQNGILRCQRDLRIPAMEKNVNITWSSTQYPDGELPIPSDLLSLKEINYTDSCGGRTLREEPLSIVLRRNVEVSHPEIFARRGAYYKLAPTPTDGDELAMDYHGEFSQLEEDTDQNFLTVAAYDMLAYAACCEASTYYVDSRLQMFEGKYTQAQSAIQDQADSDELTVGAAVAPTYLFED